MGITEENTQEKISNINNFDKTNNKGLFNYIVLIQIEEKTIATGFFIEIIIDKKNFKFLLNNISNISLKGIIEINILYNNVNKKINLKNRFYFEEIVAFIEIFDEDLIFYNNNFKCLSFDEDYKKEYSNYEKKNMNLIFINNIENKTIFAYKGIINKTRNNFEFEHSLSPKFCKKGDPIFLFNNSESNIIGICVQSKNGYFIEFFIDQLIKNFLEYNYLKKEYKHKIFTRRI